MIVKITPELDRSMGRVETLLGKLLKYSSGQPRDNHGRFASGGGGVGGSAPDTGGSYGGGGGGNISPSSEIAKKVSRATKGAKAISDPESQRILGNLVESPNDSGMSILDYVGGKSPFTKQEWSRLVDGKRTGPYVTKRDVDSKLKVLKASSTIVRNREAKISARGN